MVTGIKATLGLSFASHERVSALQGIGATLVTGPHFARIGFAEGDNRPRSSNRTRRKMLTRRVVFSGLAAIGSTNLLRIRGAWSENEEHVVHSDAEWRGLLTADQYAVLRKEGTERPFTSPLLHEERRGIFACAGCGLTSSPPRPNSTVAPAGRASGRRSTTR
jgi:hypothetical protein